MTELMSQTAYAKHKGVSRQYINELVRDGVLRLKRGKIDRDEADMTLEARREPLRPLRRKSTEQKTKKTQKTKKPAQPKEEAEKTKSRPKSELPTILLETKIRSETEKVKLLEIKNKVESGKYIDRDEAEAKIFKRLRPIRDTLLSIPDRLSADLTASQDRHNTHKILYDEIVRILDDATKPFLKK